MTYKSGTILDQADVATRNAMYLYSSGDSYAFMELDNSEMHDIPAEQIEDVAPYLKENLNCFVMVYEGAIIGVILPLVVEYKVVETVPGVKGDRQSA